MESKDTLHHVTNLPLELSHAIFDLADKADVVRMAGVSHQWRAAALAHRLFYCLLSMEYEALAEDAHRYDPEPFSYYAKVVAQACAAGTPVKIRLFVSPFDSTAYELFHTDGQYINDVVLYRVHGILEGFLTALLAPALEQVIGGLEIIIPEYYYVRILPLLAHRAPRLAQLSIHCLCDDAFDGNDPTSLPHALFDGHAPLLQEVSFQNIRLEDSDSVFSAFSAVRHVSIAISTD
ncbi:hypothetical protein AURDEDRAFT_175775 [Auricularia subglabra TFB-10046 SS5]|uniref:F-box domain-containing protein n=1 Tax=Auricularia subglabra (strain TFB-10046 / SS5) TaxID=717982 RepID=J0D7N2_AURST|nr:hypothetical protein AURDEDRAFT_175775 [Auricularia subglabra TFB-10046 SS5]